ncbi:non-ribosomal peptide synthetase [Levilactobacillus namurensis]|uniref:non-ribosomal peptide synthetase n=1 Tax=Levilactobacillus namurensis TaxID=380393 RepID=UPI0026F21E0E|nr:non-ribosomal peptide synthetase [Levilactobacillus namurensis]
MSIYNKLLDLKFEDSPKIFANGLTLTGREFLKQVGAQQERMHTWGIKSGDVVPVIMSPGVDALATVLALGLIGATYVPISTDAPRKRIAYIISDISPNLVLTNQKYLLIANQVTVKYVDMIQSTKKQPAFPKYEKRDGTDVAYIIYTSGSTGAPKGVEVTYENLESFVLAYNSIFTSDESSIFLLNTSLQFDVSISEIYGWISRKSGIRLLSTDELKDIKNLPYFVKKYKITHLAVAPSTLGILDKKRLNVLNSGSLKYLMVAGEKFPVSLAKALDPLVKEGVVYNCYGPTEGTVYATYHKLNASDKYKERIPIGKPMPNTKAILKENNHSKKFELFISGKGVALGYLNHPDKTAAVFSQKDKVPVYETGDLVVEDSQTHDLEYIGRKDFQIEINSIRIEPGEIEAEIIKSGRVTNCIVTMIQSKLTCFYTSIDKKGQDAFLKSYLKALLPKYMIPKQWQHLLEFPLTINGKIDRKKLVNANDVFRARTRANTIDDLTLKIQDICHIVNLSEFDNIFDYGVDSLSAVQVEVMLEGFFKTNIPVGFLYSHPTVHDIKQTFDKQRSNSKVLKTAFINQHDYQITGDDDNLNILCKNNNANIIKNKLTNDIHIFNALMNVRSILGASKRSIFSNENNPETTISGGIVDSERSYPSSIFQKVYCNISLNSFTVSSIDIDDDLYASKTKDIISGIIEGTEAFRTKIKKIGPVLSSLVFKNEQIVPGILDISTESSSQQVEIIDKAVNSAESAIMDNLLQSYLFKIIAFRLSARSVKIVFVCHHCISDGATKGQLSEKVGNLLRGKVIEDPKMKNYLQVLSKQSHTKTLLNEPTIRKIKILQQEREQLVVPHNVIFGTFMKQFLGVSELDNWQKMMFVANKITKQYLEAEKLNVMTFQMLFNLREVKGQSYRALINDCHETVTFFRNSLEDDLTFLNKLYSRIVSFHLNDGVSLGMAIYANFPEYTAEQNELKNIVETSPVNIDYIGEVEPQNVEKEVSAMKALKNQLKGLKNQIRFTAFSSGNNMYVFQVN